MTYRSPVTIRVEKKPIRVLKQGRFMRMWRWYVTFDFDGQLKKLAIPERAAVWLKRKRGAS